ncbi:MAG: aldehyde ferredoxin oxidoreductase family protein [Candidatus Thorarchaeota archaeon]|nr:aldehyde ferredoxin oxidoreductase family protein [Candidatus Thorarchaeota archaeon]
MTFPYKGYAGSYLEVDLNKGKVHKHEMEKEWALFYMGGTGVAARILWDRTGPKTEPLSPENVMVVGTGPLTGVLFSPSGRCMFASKGPLTGIWAESHVGGFFGPEMKYAGFDLVLLHGRSPRPVYLFLRDGDAELRDASYLWGKETDVTTEMIREEHKDPEIETAVIGPAGENQVLYASITVDFYRAAGRTGMGAVLGSKNVKAIAASGSLPLEAHDMDRYIEANGQEMARLRDPLWTESLTSLRKYGTTGLVTMINEIGRLPTKNHWTGFYEHAEDIGPEVISKRYKTAQEACLGCAIGCKYIYRVGEGKFAGGPAGGPEYETIMAFGSNCMNNNIESIFYLGTRCDLLGMDTISCGKTIGFAMELWEKGILTAEKTGGLDLSWGNVDTMVRLVEMIAKRDGIGDLLSRGTRKAAEALGGDAWMYAVHCKGLEASGQDPRAHQSVGLTYATNVRGADHLRSLSSLEELGYPEVIVGRFGEEKFKAISEITSPVHKGEVIKDIEDLYALVDSAVICKYGTMWPPVFYFDTFANVIPPLTGMTEWADIKFVRQVAERISHLRRAYNHRLGVTRKEETLPRRLLLEPMPTGPAKGGLPNLDYMLDEYYDFRGCDRRTGLPFEEKLHSLGLDFVREDLKTRGGLPSYPTTSKP